MRQPKKRRNSTEPLGIQPRPPEYKKCPQDAHTFTQEGLRSGLVGPEFGIPYTMGKVVKSEVKSICKAQHGAVIRLCTAGEILADGDCQINFSRYRLRCYRRKLLMVIETVLKKCVGS